MSNGIPKMIATGVRLESLELKRVKERTARLFAALEEALEAESPDLFDSFLPPVDIGEAPDSVRVYVELPGVKAEDICLSLTAEQVVIEGVKSHSVNTEKVVSHYCCERSYGRFRRVLQMRWAVNVKAASASLRNGTLEILLPKLDDRRGVAVRIPVTEIE
jgi:HSP20 family protein